MELKHLIQRFAYKIEPKPEGGFIARAADPTTPSLEAPTREELQQKIQANLLAALQQEFPGLKLPAMSGLTNPSANQGVSYEVHVERKPGGGFSVHSGKPGDPTTHEMVDHLVERLLNAADKNLPQIAQAFAAQAGSGDLTVFVNKATSTNSGAGLTKLFAPAQPIQAKEVTVQAVTVETAPTSKESFNNPVIANTPIVPEASGTWKVLRFLLAVVILLVLMYWFSHRG
jgi:hypothetical protein